MGVLDLFVIASMPILKVLLLTAIGLSLALDGVDILGEETRKRMNKVVFYVLNPPLVGTNLAQTITFQSLLSLWFMPVNILLTFIVGSALGWILIKIARPPKRLNGLVLGCCAAGNLGNLPLIIIPAVCKEKGSPFGAADACNTLGMGYVSLSMAIGAVILWSYVFNIVRVGSSTQDDDSTREIIGTCYGGGGKAPDLLPENSSEEPLLLEVEEEEKEEDDDKVPILCKIKLCLTDFFRRMNLKALFSPSTTGAVVGFVIGVIPQIRNLMIGDTAPLHVLEDSASLLGDAAIPTVTLILGGNLLKGLKGKGVQPSILIGIVAVRYIFLPLLGIVIVRGALHFGLVHSDPLYLFVLLLQYALPPAMNIGTITQLFGAGESECSVIMLWTYALASVALTLWCTFFLWLVAS